MNTIFRRELLERDPPTDFVATLQAIRNLTGFGSSDLAFILNVPRSTLNSWERGTHPRHDDGQAILKLLATCRDFATLEPKTPA